MACAVQIEQPRSYDSTGRLLGPQAGLVRVSRRLTRSYRATQLSGYPGKLLSPGRRLVVNDGTCGAWGGSVAGTEEIVSDRAEPDQRAVARIFLSHAGIDTMAARQLKERILAAPDAEGIEVWFDKDDLDAG